MVDCFPLVCTQLGDGLEEEIRSKLFTEYLINANTDDGTKIRTRVTGGDGYDETARLSVEMTLLLTMKRDELPFVGGVLTPAVAGGHKFVEALQVRKEKNLRMFPATYQYFPSSVCLSSSSPLTQATGINFEVLDDEFKVDFSKLKERLV